MQNTRALVAESSTYIIAEIGVNHDGEIAKALELVEAVADSGADAVKIQTFTAETLVSADAPKAAYQLVTTSGEESQYEMLKRLELSREDHWVVKEAAKRLGLGFLSTPYDRESLRFLVDELGVDQVKIASSDLTNLPLLLEAGRSGRTVILSTGMATLDEIRRALATLAFGATRPIDERPMRASLTDTVSPAAREYLDSSVVLMQCTSQYPAPASEANLRSIATLRDLFGVSVGYSDHTVGVTSAVMSVAYGSSTYEKHFTLDRTAAGPDHSASIEPEDFRALVALIREAETCRGSGVKEPSPSEQPNRFPMRKSLMAARAISAGAVITEADIALMRPEIGDTPDHYWEWLDRESPRAFAQGEPLTQA